MTTPDPLLPANPLATPLIRELQERYKSLGRAPPWAWPWPPSIPLIGGAYRTGGLLLYAGVPAAPADQSVAGPGRFFASAAAWNRYEHRLTRWRRDRAAGRAAESFFPVTGIEPVQNGGLLTAGLYLAQQRGLPLSEDPAKFLDSIAVSHYCKFTCRPEPGARAAAGDYLDDPGMVWESVPYLRAELTALQPSVVLLPHRAAYWLELKRQFPNTRFVAAHQFHPGIGRWLKGRAPQAARLERATRHTYLRQWVQAVKVPGVSPQQIWCFLAEVQAQLTG